jgi:hypothetical protein
LPPNVDEFIEFRKNSNKKLANIKIIEFYSRDPRP